MLKKKILFVLTRLENGGAERVITHVANHIDRRTYTPEILLIKKSEHSYLAYLKDDIVVTKLNIRGTIGLSIYNLIKAIRHREPDIVFVGNSGLSGFLSVLIPFNRRFRWVVRETNTVSMRITSRVTSFIYRHFYKNYDLIIAQCDDMKNDLVKHFGIPGNKFAVINNPIDTSFIDKKLAESCATHYPAGKTNLVACGRLTYQKGFDNLINAFALLGNKDAFHLTILGKGDPGDLKNQETELRQLVANLHLESHVTFAGFQENSYAWFHAADVFVLSSRFEGFPNVLLEALYCGTPSLAIRCPGGIDTIIEEGKNGFMFQADFSDFGKQLDAVVATAFDKKNIRTALFNKYNAQKIIEIYQQNLDKLYT